MDESYSYPPFKKKRLSIFLSPLPNVYKYPFSPITSTSSIAPTSMKVLLINTSDHTGGAAIAALRILQALQHQGVEAKLLCRDRNLPTSRTDIIQLRSTPWLKMKFFLERLDIFIRNGFKREGLFSIDTGRFGTDITRLPAFQEADVIHLHWVNQAMLSLQDLKKILQSGKRIVWTMHDMWPFTGICHNAADCLAWKDECKQCPLLPKPGAKDLSTRIFRKKVKTYACGQMSLVGCSQWLTQLAQQAPLLQGHQVTSIPNPIDTTFYRPGTNEGEDSQEQLREALGLPVEKRLLLFTAFKVTDPNKGIDYLIESITLLCQEHPELRDHIAIVLAGKEAETLTNAFAVPAYSMGYVTDEAKMRNLYQACDLLLMPTLMDNLPNTIVEAMACGIPCVAFQIGGVPQMIDSGINGFLAAYRNSLDFAHNIYRALYSQSYPALCRNARSKAVAAYSEKAVADKYIQLYRAEGNPH